MPMMYGIEIKELLFARLGMSVPLLEIKKLELKFDAMGRFDGIVVVLKNGGKKSYPSEKLQCFDEKNKLEPRWDFYLQ